MGIDDKVVLLGSEGSWDSYEAGVHAEKVFPGQDVSELFSAIHYNRGPEPTEEPGCTLTHVKMLEQGQRDGADWVWEVGLSNDHCYLATGGCDYHGWDCQSYLEWVRQPDWSYSVKPASNLPVRGTRTPHPASPRRKGTA